MSARNSFPEDHRLFAGFLVRIGRASWRASPARISSSVLGAPAFTYHVEGFGPHVPPGAKLIQLVDDPTVAAWAPAGVSIVTHLQLGIRSLLAGPHRERAPRRRCRRERRACRPIASRIAISCSRSRELRPAGSIIVEEAPSSRGPMHDYLPILEAGHLLHLRERRPGSRPAGRGRHGARAAQRSRDRVDGRWRPARIPFERAVGSPQQLGLRIVFIVVRNGRYSGAPRLRTSLQPAEYLPGTPAARRRFLRVWPKDRACALISRPRTLSELDAVLRRRSLPFREVPADRGGDRSGTPLRLRRTLFWARGVMSPRKEQWP